MSVVIQEEQTGCGIASVANIVGLSYAEVKVKANKIGIFAEDELLYSDTNYVRALLKEYGFNTSENELLFSSWEDLPSLALLAVKYYVEDEKPFWHWVVFKKGSPSCVLDSASYIEENRITSFVHMHPKWYIAVTKN